MQAEVLSEAMHRPHLIVMNEPYNEQIRVYYHSFMAIFLVNQMKELARVLFGYGDINYQGNKRLNK